MESIAFVNAFYIKLGRAGAWEADSIRTGKLRLGWRGQSVEDINARRWGRIEQQLREEHQGKPPGVATTDLNALKAIAESTSEDVWITFYQAKLWWARRTGPVEQDRVSKFRRTAVPWSDRAANDRLLVTAASPGRGESPPSRARGQAPAPASPRSPRRRQPAAAVACRPRAACPGGGAW